MNQVAEHTCPKCLGGIPNNLERGKYPGALSRIDNTTMICSDCGTQEALEDYTRKVAPWYIQQCRECDRTFNLNDETESDEFFNGHDCEV